MVELIHTHKGTVYAQRNGVLIPVNTDGLVGYWPMTEGSGGTLYDESKNGNAGTIIGAVWTDTANGKALDFDGTDDYVEVNELNAMNGNFTVSAWVNVLSYYGDDNAIISGDSGAYGSRMPWGMWVDDGDKAIEIYDTSNTILGSITISEDTWYHVVWTHDDSAGTSNIFVDGSFDNSGDHSISSSGTNDIIGLDAVPKSTKQFNGTIDEVRIYNRALSAQEISNIYEKTRGLYGV